MALKGHQHLSARDYISMKQIITTEIEALAVVFAVKSFETYLDFTEAADSIFERIICPNNITK